MIIKLKAGTPQGKAEQRAEVQIPVRETSPPTHPTPHCSGGPGHRPRKSSREMVGHGGGRGGKEDPMEQYLRVASYC